MNVRAPQHQSRESATGPHEFAWRRWLLVLVSLGVAIGGVGAAMSGAAMQRAHSAPGSTTEPAPARDREVELPARSADSREKFTVSIRRPSGPPRVATGLTDLQGNAVTAACSTCHTTRPPDHENRRATDLDDFHSGMSFSHGTVSCLACHDERNYDALKLADGRRLAFTDVMTLCGQCHGPQMNAYNHGAHGGMTGYWDLSRGPRVKNNCIDCHDPHAPQFPKMQPTFKPRDRFLDHTRTEH